MKKLILFISLFATVQVVFAQQNNTVADIVIRVLCVIEGETLTKDELKTRLEYGQVLRPVFQGDTLVFNPENQEMIKTLPPLFVEFAESYFKIFNGLVKTFNAEEKTIVKNFFEAYKPYLTVITYYLKVKDKRFVLETTKENLLEIGVTEEDYDAIVDNIKKLNATLEESDNAIVDEKIYKEPVSTIFFPNCVFKMIGGDLRTYHRFKNSTFKDFIYYFYEKYNKQIAL